MLASNDFNSINESSSLSLNRSYCTDFPKGSMIYSSLRELAS